MMDNIKTNKRWIWRGLLIVSAIVSLAVTGISEFEEDSRKEIIVVWFVELVIMDTLLQPLIIALVSRCCRIRNLVPYLRG